MWRVLRENDRANNTPRVCVFASAEIRLHEFEVGARRTHIKTEQLNDKNNLLLETS